VTHGPDPQKHKEGTGQPRSSGQQFDRRQFLTGTIVGGAALFVSAAALRSVDYSLEVTHLHVGLGARLTFLPDLHIHEIGEAHVEKTLKALEDVDTDMLVIGGDLVDEETKNLEAVGKFLDQLDVKEKLSVLGNHEYWSGHAKEVAAALRSRGFEVLLNEHVQTSVGPVFGYDWSEERRYQELRLNGLVIAHDPNAADSVKGRALVLSGHTHGGLVLNGHTIYSNSRYVRGHYRLGGEVHLYVSRGVGQMSFQFRVWSRPELLILD